MTLELDYGPPTEEDIKQFRDSWYQLYHTDKYFTKDGRYEVVDFDEGHNYGCVVHRKCDDTYWRIRDVFGTYRKWLGPNIPVRVVPKTRTEIYYERLDH